MSTETIDPRYVDIDLWPTEAAVAAMLDSQLAAIEALRPQTAAIAAASDAAAGRLAGGGRLVYVGAGTSGRIAVQDGVELTPTYGWPEERLLFLMAGGMGALTAAVEGAEDDAGAGRDAIAAAGIGSGDVVVGVAASGRTPYVLAALQAARESGALTVAVANNPGSPLLGLAEHAILADTGAEVIAGSTRMKAGTAQKAALNLLSTATMLRCGLVYRGLMVNMRISNAKLQKRGREMVRDLAGVAESEAAAALERAGGEIKKAVLLAMGRSDADAEVLLVRHRSNLRAAIEDR